MAKSKRRLAVSRAYSIYYKAIGLIEHRYSKSPEFGVNNMSEREYNNLKKEAKTKLEKKLDAWQL